MTEIKIHKKENPSYFGDQLRYAFPNSSKEEIENNSGNDTIDSIERIDSIVIKASRKVTPFPKDPIIENDHNTGSNPDNSEYINWESNYKTESTPASSERNSSVYESELNAEKKSLVDDFEKKLRSRQNSESSCYESESVNLPVESSHKRINSNNTMNSKLSTQSFINPYLRGSVVRRHFDELKNDKLLHAKVNSMINLGVNNVDVNEFNRNKSIRVSQKKINKRLDSFDKKSYNSNSSWMSIRKHRRGSSVSTNNTVESSDNTIGTVGSNCGKLNKGNDYNDESAEALDTIIEKEAEVPIVVVGTSSLERRLSNLNKSGTNFGRSSSSPSVRPFDVSKTLSRKSSLKRQFSNVSKGLKSSQENPPLLERTKSDSSSLKRSNAIKRKVSWLSGLINIFKSLSKNLKTNWRRLSSRGKTIFTFGKKKKNDKKYNISRPIKAVHVSSGTNDVQKQEIPILRSFNSQTRNNLTKLSTILSNDKESDEIVSENGKSQKIDESDEMGEDNEELRKLWNRYLKITVGKRIEMKMDLEKAKQLERAKSIRSVQSKKFANISNNENEVEKLLSKYIVSVPSTRSSTMVTAESRIESITPSTQSGYTSSIVTLTSDGNSWNSRESLSTIEDEANEFSDFHSRRSSISSVEELIDEYSFLSDDDEDEIEQSEAEILSEVQSECRTAEHNFQSEIEMDLKPAKDEIESEIDIKLQPANFQNNYKEEENHFAFKQNPTNIRTSMRMLNLQQVIKSKDEISTRQKRYDVYLQCDNSLRTNQSSLSSCLGDVSDESDQFSFQPTIRNLVNS